MHEESGRYERRSAGQFTNDEGQSIEYDNHVIAVMGGNVKVRQSDLDLRSLVEGENVTIHFSDPEPRRDRSGYIMYVCPVLDVVPADKKAHANA